MESVRLPAYPLVTGNPYFSIWSTTDEPAGSDTTHWCGPVKPLRVSAETEDGTFRLLGLGEGEPLNVTGRSVTPTRTEYRYRTSGLELTLTFLSAAFPDDPDLFSVPAVFVLAGARSLDGTARSVTFRFSASASLTWDGDEKPHLTGDCYRDGELEFARIGQTHQKLLCHSGDHVTIDWGYLYLASASGVSAEEDALTWTAGLKAGPEGACARAVLAYDEVASILYYGTPCKAWYARNGKSLVQAVKELDAGFGTLYERCLKLDEEVLSEARGLGGEDYARIVSAAWRHTLAAHTLISTPKGEMALLSKENDSNGCIGTVDVSYPSAPFFLKYNPELADALCRPVLEFASMPVWAFSYAPHDVGRYPIVNGQVYAIRNRLREPLAVFSPWYLYPAGEAERLYDPYRQMPIEECGNMLILLAAAWRRHGDPSLIRQYGPILTGWARYLRDYGEDPEDQLCTDDFAGHLAHNMNLAAKAHVALALYGEIAEICGDPDGEAWKKMGKERLQRWAAHAKDGVTPLTLTGEGWSQKYNLAWDRVLGLGLLDDSFYEAELESYLPRINEFGLPLDQRRTYTKSDWSVWTAAMAKEPEGMAPFLRPVAHFLEATESRVAFSDWYDTVTGKYEHFIARSVQGGVFMPMLREWK